MNGNMGIGMCGSCRHYYVFTRSSAANVYRKSVWYRFQLSNSHPESRPWVCLLLVDEKTSHAHTSTNAHACQQNLLARFPALGQTSDNLSSTSGTEGMAEGNGTTAGVHLVPVELELVAAVDSHGSESFVDLDDIDIVEGEAVLVEKLGDGDGGADTHDARSQTSNGGADVLAENGLAELDGGRALHEQNSSGAIGNLGGVTTRGSGTPLGEGNADLGETLGSSAGADTLILGEGDVLPLAIGVLDAGLDGDDLVVEEAGLLGALGTLEGLGGVLVHFLAGDAKVTTDVLRGPAHGLHAVGRLLGLGGDGLVEGLLEGVAANAHGLGAHGDTDLDGAARDGVGNVGDSLEARGAEAVERVGTSGVGEAGSKGGGTKLVGGLAIGDLQITQPLASACDSP